MRKNYEIAQKLYERALALDPGFALAHAELSQVHGIFYWWRYDPSPGRAALQLKEAEAALQIAPNLPQAHVAMGRAHAYGRLDYQRALEEYAIALKSLPNESNLWAEIGYAQRRLGNWSDAIDAFKKAAQLNPRDANLFGNLGAETYRVMHQYAEAVAAMNRALSLAPDFYVSAINKGLTYISWQGQFDTLRTTLSCLAVDENLEAREACATGYLLLFSYERQPDSLLQLLQRTRETVFKGREGLLTIFEYTARAHLLRGDSSAAAAAFDSVRIVLEAEPREQPDDWEVHRLYGLAMARLKRRDEALSEARWLQQSKFYCEDAYEGPKLAAARAEILALAGESNAAMDEIERLLAKPSWLSVHNLRLRPMWDPIREHPRFKELLKKYAIQ